MMWKKKLKLEWKKEWKSKQFKFLFITTIILIFSWIIVSFFSREGFYKWIIDIVRVSTLFIYIISLFIYNRMGKKWGDYNIFEKFYNSYLIIILFIFGLMYLFLIIFSSQITLIWVFVLSIFILFLIHVLIGILALMKSRNFIGILLAYLFFVFSLILLFGFIFACSSAFPPNQLLSDGVPITKTWDMIYFSSVTFFSLGYGDIYPVGTGMKLISQLEVLFGTIIHVIIIAWILKTVWEKRKSKNENPFNHYQR